MLTEQGCGGLPSCESWVGGVVVRTVLEHTQRGMFVRLGGGARDCSYSCSITKQFWGEIREATGGCAHLPSIGSRVRTCTTGTVLRGLLFLQSRKRIQ
jgi:hypothetical protein